jgi:Ca-activated chloride channel family protein
MKEVTLGALLGLALSILVSSCSISVSVRAETRPACDIALVLAMDVSGSVDADEYELQRDGTAAAFRSPEIARAVERADGVAVIALEWSAWAQTTVPWTILRTAEDAAAFADALGATRRSGDGATFTGGALHHATRALDRAPCVALREIVDISTDGESNDTFEAQRDSMIERGATVNVLAVPDERRLWLPDWLRQNIVTPGGFLIEAHGYEAFGPAIRKKLSIELTMLR